MIPTTFTEQSACVAIGMFFAFIKAVFVALVLLVGVLIVGQSHVAPVSVNLLTAYAVEYAVNTFKPYRGYFPEPYLIHIENK